MSKRFSRRDFFRASAATVLATTGAAALAQQSQEANAAPPLHPGHGGYTPSVVGEVNHQRNGFDPSEVATDFDYGTVSQLENGQTLREFEIVAEDKLIEIVPGIEFTAWTYNGRIPGPTLRCTEGDLIRVHFSNNGSEGHTLHFHGFHPYEMDGTPTAGPGTIWPEQSFTYEFEAGPVGLHLYHSYIFPLSRTISRGLYGAYIVDPADGWPAIDHEFVIVLNGFDTNFDGKNEFYAANAIPFHYQKHPIQISLNQTVRLFLVNMVQYDPVSSFHLHANFFDYFPTGTRLTSQEYTDTIMQAPSQRGILEFSYQFPGLYTFRSSNNSVTELGCLGSFLVSI